MSTEKQDFSFALKHKIDQKTKPLGALGMLESLAFQIGSVQHSLKPSILKPTLVVFAGDHGIALEKVSAYPQEVTHQMVLNFLHGGAAINVFCRQNDMALKIVDAGVNFDFPPHPELISAKVNKGTQNFLKMAAMSEDELNRCQQHGHKIVNQIYTSGCNVIGFGEMGIGNTSAASMLMSVLCQLPVTECVGRGTGLNDTQYQNKMEILQRARDFHSSLSNPYEVLRTFGGFEMAQMFAAMLRAYELNMLILVDGFIATSTFLAAYCINQHLLKNAVFCHCSDELGHARLLSHLNVSPLLHLGLRLGEGTGCALALPLLKSAVAFLNEMSSFQTAGVSSL